MSFRSKLNRLKPHITNKQENQIPLGNHDAPKVESKHIPFQDEWVKEGVTPYFYDGEYCLVREKVYPIEEKYGRYTFSQFLKAVEAWNNSSTSHPLSSKGYSPEQLFFFDTETTGLGGGVGNTIFLLGYASFMDNKIVLKQHILPKPGAEVPLYQSFLENIDYETLVTYNGKAFDWPQVKTRHTLIKELVPRLPAFGHFDLFHAARRLWKHKLDRLKLSIVEKEVLHIEREDDVPGFLAPMIYFDFVENEKPEGMLGILKHNEMDILSLITLYTHISFQLLNIDEEQTVPEAYEVGRWYASLGESKAATETLEQVATSFEKESVKAKYLLSFEWKKKKEWDKARTLWKELTEDKNKKIAYEACVELAKYYEHKGKDIEKALLYSDRAFYILQEMMKIWKLSDNQKLDEIKKRLDRLNKKKSKPPIIK